MSRTYLSKKAFKRKMQEIRQPFRPPPSQERVGLDVFVINNGKTFDKKQKNLLPTPCLEGGFLIVSRKINITRLWKLYPHFSNRPDPRASYS
ncbi:MAG: hypothetical protein IJ205_05670 [Bacteroidales bacterium]|nr:hypothetical protein [Bacteroidales bacterium]